jgi:hypothetical protein
MAASAAASSDAPAERGSERELAARQVPEHHGAISATDLQRHPSGGEVHVRLGVGVGLIGMPDAVDRPG